MPIKGIDTKTVTTPVEIKDLLWNDVPAATEYQTAADLHNTLILAAFLRGKDFKESLKHDAIDSDRHHGYCIICGMRIDDRDWHLQ